MSRAAEPPRWPADAFGNGPVTIPPGDETVEACALWPECGCGERCADAAPPPLPRWLRYGWALALAAIVAGLFWQGWR